MAEETTKKKLSPQTEAIVDRLKREGSLTRNGGDGKNSIKQVNVNLEKFVDTFAAIQKNTSDTAKIMTENFQENTEIIKKVDETLEGLTDEQQKAELARRKEAAEQTRKNKESSREDLFGRDVFYKNMKSTFDGLKTGFMNVKKNPWGSLLTIGKWAIILPVIAGAIKGILDLMFGDSEMKEFYDGFRDSAFVKFVKDPNWGVIISGLLVMSALNWTKMYLSMMMMAKAMGVNTGGPTVIPTGTDAGKGGSLKDKARNILKKAKSPKGGLVGALALVTIGGITYALSEEGEPIDITDEVKRINDNVAAEDEKQIKNLVETYENERRGFGTILSEALMGGAAGGAFGSFFGGVGAIPGAVSGAVLGALSGILQVGYDTYQDMAYDIDRIPNELEAALKEEQRNQFNYGPRNRRLGKKTAEEIAALAETTNATIDGVIDSVSKDITSIDGEIKSAEALLSGNITSKRVGGRRGRMVDYVTVDGQLVRKSEVEANLEKMKEERVLREQQIATSKRILAMRKGELKELEDNNTAIQENTEAVKEATEKTNDSSVPDIAPGQYEEKERRQHVAAGGFALNVTNNYYNKGGDTVVTQQSDNRVASSKNTSIFSSGGRDNNRFGGNLPSGAMA